ncbi:hypothetical protein FGK60_12970 [Streptomyces sp. DASNCL29]|nr:hypothetical protein FGK60_12970 [Streptomyces sp. DASNCL29]
MAARPALRLDGGLITAAVEVRSGDDGPEAVQSVFAGSYAVVSAISSTCCRSSANTPVRTERSSHSHVYLR